MSAGGVFRHRFVPRSGSGQLAEKVRGRGGDGGEVKVSPPGPVEADAELDFPLVLEFGAFGKSIPPTGRTTASDEGVTSCCNKPQSCWLN